MARPDLPAVLRRLVAIGRSVSSSAPTGSSGRAPSARPGRSGAIDHTWAGDHDGRPDPGEIVWTWVPYEEDHARGKDRPVLLVGHDGPWLLGLMLSSRDHDARPGPGRWLDLGTGDWDARRRPSEVRLDRVVRVAPGAVRREGAVLDAARFAAVADALER